MKDLWKVWDTRHSYLLAFLTKLSTDEMQVSFCLLNKQTEVLLHIPAMYHEKPPKAWDSSSTVVLNAKHRVLATKFEHTGRFAYVWRKMTVDHIGELARLDLRTGEVSATLFSSNYSGHTVSCTLKDTNFFDLDREYCYTMESARVLHIQRYRLSRSAQEDNKCVLDKVSYYKTQILSTSKFFARLRGGILVCSAHYDNTSLYTLVDHKSLAVRSHLYGIKEEHTSAFEKPYSVFDTQFGLSAVLHFGGPCRADLVLVREGKLHWAFRGKYRGSHPNVPLAADMLVMNPLLIKRQNAATCRKPKTHYILSKGFLDEQTNIFVIRLP